MASGVNVQGKMVIKDYLEEFCKKHCLFHVFNP